MGSIMRVLLVFLLFLAMPALAQEGPADHMWELYQEGRFEDVVREGKVELTTGTPTAQVNLAVGRSLVDLERSDEGLIYLETAVRLDPGQTWVYAWAQNYLGAAHFHTEDDTGIVLESQHDRPASTSRWSFTHFSHQAHGQNLFDDF